MLKTLKRFRSEKYSVFIEGINKIALNSNDNQKIQSIALTEIDST